MDLASIKSLPKTAAKYSHTVAWIMVILSFLMTIMFWRVVREESYQNASVRFDFRVNEIVTSIKKRLLAYEQVLLGGSGLFAASKYVDRTEWKSYVEKLNIEQNYPGILGIGFSRVLLPSEKDKYIKSVRKDGFPNFWIWPEGDREIYTTIVYLEPFKGRNLRAFGYDMFTNPIRKKAMALARDEGTTSISGKVTLVQETDKDVQSGFLMYVPLYRQNMPLNTVEQRRKALFGYVYSPFRMNDLVEGILGEQFRILNLSIYDGDNASDKNLMYTSFPSDTFITKSSASFILDERINFGGHSWTIKFISLPEFNKTIDSEKSWIALIAGGAITLLFFTVAISLTTSRKLYKKTEQILESTGEGIFGLDLKGYCTFVNKSAIEMLGFDPLQSHKKIHELIHHSYPNGKNYAVEDCPIYKSLVTKNICIKDDEVFWRADGTSFPVEYSSSPIIEKGEVKGGVVTFTDITERKKSEKMIDDSLKEKDVLLREIHHRVKNNMQIISSLLNLQSSYLQDSSATNVFKESQNRIRSMALIHEKLYQSGNLAAVKLRDYVQDLAAHLMSSYSLDSAKIKLVTDIDDVSLGIDVAISLGLIINELLSNSFKYAFPGGTIGEIKIFFKPNDINNSTLIIKDNGIGFPKDVNFRQTESLGLQLVNTLVDQLEGTIELETHDGTEFIIMLPNIK
jgi:PAS domain S-box-containing protein